MGGGGWGKAGTKYQGREEKGAKARAADSLLGWRDGVACCQLLLGHCRVTDLPGWGSDALCSAHMGGGVDCQSCSFSPALRPPSLPRFLKGLEEVEGLEAGALWARKAGQVAGPLTSCHLSVCHPPPSIGRRSHGGPPRKTFPGDCPGSQWSCMWEEGKCGKGEWWWQSGGKGEELGSLTQHCRIQMCYSK